MSLECECSPPQPVELTADTRVGNSGKGVGGIFKKNSHARRSSQSDMAAAPLTAAGIAPIESANSNELEMLADPASAAAASPRAGAIASGNVTPPTSTVGTLQIGILALEGTTEHDESKSVVVRSGSKTIKETKAHKGDVMSIQYGETAVVKTGDGPFELSFSVV